MKTSARATSSSLEVYVIDLSNSLDEERVVFDRAKKTGEPKQMLTLACHCASKTPDVEQIVDAIETAWLDAALGEEAHTVSTSQEAVTLDFVGWSPDEYVTGRIEVKLPS